MGNIDEIINYHAVRIAVEDGRELKGSGIIFPRAPKKKTLIFTAAHVIDEIWGAERDLEKNLYLSCSDMSGNWKVIRIQAKIKKCTGEELDVEDTKAEVYIHSDYNKDNLTNDAAVICVPWEEWMGTLGNFEIDNAKIGGKQKFCGFPEAADEEWEQGTEGELAGKCQIEGQAGGLIRNRYSITYHHEVLGAKIKRENTMIGFSGSGVIEVREEKLVLVGLISKPLGNDNAGNILWACSGNVILELIAQAGFELNIPESFSDYIEFVKKIFPPRRKKEKAFFVDTAEELIEDKGLTPAKVITKDGFFEELKCENNRKYCTFFWQGQLKKAVILSLKGVSVDEMSHPKIQMPEPYEKEWVFIEFLCTEEEQEDVLSILIKKNYFSSDGKLSDGTIFIWNTKEGGRSLWDDITRGECRGIIVDIAEDLSKKERMRKFGNMFDIVNGEIIECNLAMIGIESLMKVISSGKGSKEKMEKELEDILKKLWEV